MGKGEKEGEQVDDDLLLSARGDKKRKKITEAIDRHTYGMIEVPLSKGIIDGSETKGWVNTRRSWVKTI